MCTRVLCYIFTASFHNISRLVGSAHNALCVRLVWKTILHLSAKFHTMNEFFMSAASADNNNSNSQAGRQAVRKAVRQASGHLTWPARSTARPFFWLNVHYFFHSFAVLKKAKADADIAALPITIVIVITIIIIIIIASWVGEGASVAHGRSFWSVAWHFNWIDYFTARMWCCLLCSRTENAKLIMI